MKCRLLLLSLVFAVSAEAQQGPTSADTSNTAFVAVAVFTEEAPRIDGHIDEALWQEIDPITNFTQLWPEEGASPTEHSEVRIAYDRDNLYFAFKLFDDNPELIRAKNLERGGRNDRDDHAYISLDTYLDKRNAYLFEMNALGTQDDATITDEGLTIDSFSWDAVFISETVIDEDGWSMEVSIPFRQLRFPKGEELEFGLMLSRMINRKNERVMWPPIGLEFGTFGALAAVSQYGKLTGMKNVRRGKNLEIKPYVIARAQEERENLQTEATNIEYSRDLGVDIKYGISSNLTLDLTLNTDFAQVESDNVQLNLTRFSLFFPEKREFFLERSGLFEHGNPRSTQTFFSRRIGLTNQILAGGRMTGQIGRFSVGVLNIETGEEIGDLLGTRSANNTVARLRTSLFPRATVGAIFTNFEQNGYYNRAVGLDGQYRFWGSSEFSTWYTSMQDADKSLNDDAGHVSLLIQNELVGGQATFTSIGENFNPVLGFVRRRNIREYRGRVQYNPLIESEALPMIRRLNFLGGHDYIEGQNGVKQSTRSTLISRVQFNRRDFISLQAEQQFERLAVPFFIQSNTMIPAGDYTFSQLGISGGTDSSRRLYGTAGLTGGKFFNGDRTDLTGSLGFRQSQYLQLEGTANYSKIDLPVENGSFNATTVSLAILGAVSRKFFAKALVQYDNFSRDIQANIRFDWIHTPGSDLFLVLNTSNHIAGDHDMLFDPNRDIILNNRVGIVKLTYLVLL